ncbi:MAG: metallophosphoesterase [Clostridia bacterium]|nr:metallophosphoesterase [Clostridia bacterium]
MGCLGRALRRLITRLLPLLMIAYLFVEPFWLSEDRRTLFYTNLPPAFDGMRVAFVTDIHVGPFFSQERLAKLVARIDAWHPDIILLGGDYATDSDSAVAFFAAQPGFSAPMGVYAVPGNHDRVLPEANLLRLLRAMREAGVTPLCNAVEVLRADGQSIYLAGIDDYAVGHPDIVGVAVASRADVFTIFVMHNPDGIPEALAARDINGNQGWANLILCGHTHGGQVTIFGQRALSDINRATGERFRTGWKWEGGADILVSNGVGTTLLPIRFFARPQIHFLTLRRAQ